MTGRIFVSTLVLTLFASTGFAAESAYTKLDLEKNCVFHSEYEAGAEAYCTGFKGYPVHFSEGDLRQMVRFGHVAKLDGQWESFGQFNRVNDTIEWRIEEGKPWAAILRWFIENTDDNGEVSPASIGQVLVVSSVADHDNPVSCVMGYVDARANSGANEIARQLADDLGPIFECGVDEPEFYGERGPLSGDPNRVFD